MYEIKKNHNERNNLLERIREFYPNAIPVPNILGEEIFTVEIDASSILASLIGEAQNLKDLPFDEKLEKIIDLTIKALPKNSVEEMANGDMDARNLVLQSHPLSDALEVKSGCCRYQAALFFILSREAGLGSCHYLLTQRMGERAFTVYNVVYNGEERHLVSIFNRTLSPRGQKFRYPEPNSANPDDFSRQQKYYAYFTDEKGNIITIKTPILTPNEKKIGVNHYLFKYYFKH